MHFMSRLCFGRAAALLAVAALAVASGSARADLIGLYTFDDGTANDSSSFGNHADVFGGVTPNPFGGSDGLGYFNFNGTSGVVHTPLDINPDTNPRVTMGAWARVAPGTPAGIRQVLAHDDGGWDRAIGTDNRVQNDGNGDPTWRWTGFTGDGPLGPTQPVALDTWTFVAAVYDASIGQTRIHVDNNTYTDTDAPSHGLSQWNLFIGANPLSACCAEWWRGDIDNVFVFNEALSAAEIDAIRTGGPATIAGLRPELPRVLLNTWDFEGGNLGDFSVVPGHGTAFDQQPVFGDNLKARNAPWSNALLGGGMEGDWWVGTYDLRPTPATAPGGVQGDGVTGVIQSSPFVLVPGAQFDALVGAGRHPWTAAFDPDTPPAPNNTTAPTVLTLERMVAPDNWEVIFSSAGINNETLHSVHWDASAYAGETVRLRVYDLHTGGWGHINVDSIRYFQAIPEPSTAALLLCGALGWLVVARRRRARA
jgi:hypothetical protein